MRLHKHTIAILIKGLVRKFAKIKLKLRDVIGDITDISTLNNIWASDEE